MATSKTKTTEPLAPSALASKVKEHRDNAAAARSVAVEAVAKLDAAREHLNEIEGNARGGDTVAPADHYTAVSAVRLAELAAVGADARAKRAHDKGEPFRPILAELVAELLTRALSIPAHVVVELPAKLDTPALYVIQDKPGTAVGPQALDGVVRVHYSREDIHRQLTADDYRDAVAPFARLASREAVQATGNGARIALTAAPLVPYSDVAPTEGGARDVVAQLAVYCDAGHVVSAKLVGQSRDGSVRRFEVHGVISTPAGVPWKAVGQTATLGRIVEADVIGTGTTTVPANAGAFGPKSSKTLEVRAVVESTTEPYLYVTEPAAYRPTVAVVDGVVQGVDAVA